MSEETLSAIKQQIDDNPIILYMKGSRDMPMCGFSAKVVEILNTYNKEYETVDVLLDPEIRQGIKDFSNWPTIPQLYINGQFIGGCDICIEMYDNGELEALINSASE